MLMYYLKSGATSQLPKSFKDMMDTLGKKDDIKKNRDTLRRTLIYEEERRKTSEVNEDILKEIRHHLTTRTNSTQLWSQRSWR